MVGVLRPRAAPWVGWLAVGWPTPPHRTPHPSHPLAPTTLDPGPCAVFGGSSDDSGDEEAERNLPILSQYINPTQRPQQRAAGGPAAAASPAPGAAAAAAASPACTDAQGLGSPVGGQQPPAPYPAGGSSAGASGSGASPASLPATSLEAYLPLPVCAVYREVGLGGELYPWQAECLSTSEVLKGRNLVYCAPTSGELAGEWAGAGGCRCGVGAPGPQLEVCCTPTSGELAL